MNSLLEKEGMAGQVQMVYIDPPYGIRYGSNFQPFVNRRDVKDGKDEDLTQEPEMVRAFRDTWELGIHSYLTYLRDRLLLARDLLHESGSCFVQISDENLHHVRELMDDVFGVENFFSQITFAKTSGLYPRQVFFPLADEDGGWAKLARNLKAEIDPELIEHYRGTISLPFVPGDHKRVAVKVIDDRGIESLKVLHL
jgi:DNA methylase